MAVGSGPGTVLDLVTPPRNALRVQQLLDLGMPLERARAELVARPGDLDLAAAHALRSPRSRTPPLTPRSGRGPR
eukprot:5695945-Lingulodinium_polyedra.AAC.1